MTVRATRPWPWLLGALLVGVIVIFPVGGARAAGTSHRAKPPKQADVAAARRLLGIQTRYYKAGLATRREATADVNSALAQIKQECPHSVPDALLQGTQAQRAVWMALFTEAADDLALAEVQPLDDATATEARELDRLHFSKRAVNRDLRQFSHALRLSLTVAPSDLCADVKAAAAGGFRTVPAPTTAFVNHLNDVVNTPSPSFGAVIQDILPDITTKRDRIAMAQLKNVAENYTGFVFDLALKAGLSLADGLGDSSSPASGGQAGTTTAARTRSTSSSKEIPAASAARGSRLVSVSPGIGLASRTYSSLVAASSMRSTRAKPEHPSSA
jgi:hypothetical protein